jgi:hypothetical protein
MVATDKASVDELDLMPTSRWCYVEDMSPLMTMPGRRGSNISVAGRHGVVRTLNKRYEANDVVLSLGVLGVDPDTGQHVTDRLNRVLARPTSTLRHSWAGQGTRRAVVEQAMEPVTIERQRSEPAAARISYGLTILDGFWTDNDYVTQTITGATGVESDLSQFAAATAPMTDLVITFYGPCNNPSLTHGDYVFMYGATLTSGQQLVVNTRNWTVTSGTGSAWTPTIRQVTFSPGPTFFELDPSVQPFRVSFNHTTGSGVSATCTIAGRRNYLTP